mmetsp:Transcript_23748/g.61705  ORF Transcript_23748/g.61705 Transcript_23748/m.61705 type:complete len:163 (+) Transcript_23748:2103-2591(+)|eukprot:CAMPEP_0202345922 /NCGR_PEP_ID=MMETSP1126-20121109/4942_1 /ASSEMBLY_ACC=CAM_ASM_000457 /TAXON_ID=3047 /ORGANISM="Dunaliella tertiolecta, Strain CCMP1320" /LENGTH=162 /DNA_ID=CAMNT_0048937273 /DNA_START=42 /DNA_END=530 /DNA_ORIENTATION=+
MLRTAAARGLALARTQGSAASRAAMSTGATTSGATSSAAQTNSVASLISAVKASNSSSFAAGGLTNLKSGVLPHYPTAASTGMSTQYKLLLGAISGWFLYRADTQARSHDWIVDLSLNVLQAAWLISFASFLPFRSVYMSLRGMAPHTSTPLNALKPVSMMK